jgi:hypothetical protein
VAARGNHRRLVTRKAATPPKKSAPTATATAHPSTTTRGVEKPRSKPLVERRANRTLIGALVVVAVVTVHSS